MSGPCQSLSVVVEEAVGEPSMEWMGIAFLIGMIVGLIAGAVVTYLVLLFWSKKKRDEENPDEDEEGEYDEMEDNDDYKQNGGLNSMLITQDYPGKKNKKKKKNQKANEEKEIHLEDFGIIPTTALYNEVDERRTRTSLPGKHGLLDALLKPNGESTSVELANQELDFIMLLDKEIKDGKILTVNQLIKMLLAHFAQNGAISPEFYKQFGDEVREAIVALLKQLQDEQTAEEMKLNEDPALKKDPAAMERAVEELRAKYAQRMEGLLSNEQQNVRTKLLSRTELSEDDVDAAMTRLNAGLTAFEAKTSDQLDRQRKTFEERVMRRKMIAEMRRNKQNEDQEQIVAAVEHYEDALGRLVSEGKLPDVQARELLTEYKQSMQQLQRKYDQDQRHQMETLAAKLQERRLNQISHLEEELKTETEQLIKDFDGESDMSAYIKAYHKMKEDHQERRDTLIDEMDQYELIENGRSKKPMLIERKKGIKEADSALLTALSEKYQIDDEELQDLLDDHKTRMNQFDARKKQERRILENLMSEKLAARIKAIDDDPKEDNFQEALKDRQEQVIKEVLTVQADLDEDARKKILLQHERNVRALDNQMVLSKMKQQKILEARLAEKRSKLNQLQNEKEKAEVTGAQKEIQKLEQELMREEVTFQREREAAQAELRQRLQAEADAVLKAQETEMSKLLGRMQVGKARRQAILAQQDKTLQGLQERLANEGSVNVPEQLLQQHYNELAYLQQRIQTDRLQQEAHIKDQIEAKKYQKQREIEAKLGDQRRDKGSHQSSAVFSRMMMDQQHRTVLDEMEREMKLELQKQKVEMDREFEKDLQESLNDLNTNLVMQLAAVSDMSKDDIKNLVDGAVQDTGGDATKAKNLTRHLQLGVDRAKANLGALGQLKGKGPNRAKNASPAVDNPSYDNSDVDSAEEPVRSGKRTTFADQGDGNESF